MTLPIREVLGAPGEKFPFELSNAPETLEVGSEEMKFTQPVVITGDVAAYGDNIHLTGRLTTGLTAVCARCLEEATLPISVRLNETFSKTEDEQHPDNRLYDGYVLELSGMAEEVIRLDLPIRVVCKPDCKGLCPRCAVNRNKQSCSCIPHAEESEDMPMTRPLASLGDLFNQKEV